MDASTLDISLLAHLLPKLAVALRPASVSDVITLVILALCGATFLFRGIFWDKPDPYRHIWYEKPQQQDDGCDRQQATRDIARKLDETNSNCVVFWGSQSGTAEAFANRLAKECRLRFSLPSITADLSDYDPQTIAHIPESKFVIFILSTYGEGDPSDNTAGFWDWVTQAPPPLKNLRYAAFGLGNSNYKHYNRVVDVATEKLGNVGATQLLPTARADDALRSTEEDFVSWKLDLFTMFKQSLQLEEKSAAYQPTFEVVEDTSLEPIDLHLGEPVHPRDNPRAAASSSVIKLLPIKESRELFSSGTRNCVHMELEIQEHAELVYKTGDHLAIWPTNVEGEVDLLLSALDLLARKDTPVLLRSLDSSTRIKVPSPTTILTLFRHYLEISAPVSRETIMALSQFAPTATAKSFLQELGQDRELFTAYTQQNYLTLGRLLSTLTPNQPGSWSTLPLSFIIETLPTIKPRFYSISSSSVLSPRRIAITALVTVSDLPTSSPQPHPTQIHGLTSNYLLSHSRALSVHHPSSTSTVSPAYNIASPHIYAHIRKSKFKLPVSPKTPIVMVAAGTGLAPFRAFISERAKLCATRGREGVGAMALFFGCRNVDEDWIYREEIEDCRERMGGKFGVEVAFSRPTVEDGTQEEHGGRRKRGEYVQDLLRKEENAVEVVRLLDEGANFYICGRTVMAREVTRAVVRVLVEKRGGSEEEAWEEIEGMKRRGKWREDVWG